MGLFDRPLGDLRRWLAGQRDSGELRELEPVAELPWATRPPVVLGDATRLELGNPAVPSFAMALWGAAGDVTDGRITLVGPDFVEATTPSLPLAQVVILGGEIEDPLDGYRAFREAIYGLRLAGVSTRHHPATQRVWYRAGQEALDHGFGGAMLGTALVDRCGELPFADGVEVVLVTGAPQVTSLQPTAELAADIGAALTQMSEEMAYDCETCDYSEVCDQIDELKALRDKLRQEERP
ncbi:MAG: hypothetical protein JRI68_06370 [Deltaproteobacteria bacterium]|nr:hypothetical protein [Deltaproteobacteria bacterium]